MEQIVSILKFVFKSVNTLCPQYTKDFKRKIFLTLFYNFSAASSKEFQKKRFAAKPKDNSCDLIRGHASIDHTFTD